MERHIYPYFGKEKKLYKIDDETITKFLKYMFQKDRKDGKGTLGVRTVEQTYTALSWLIKYCSTIAKPKLMTRNWTNDIVFKNLIPKGKIKKKKEKKVHTLEQLLDLLDKVNAYTNIRLKTQLNIIADGGCRREEVCGLKWKDINLLTGALEYETAITSDIPKKWNKKYGGTRAKSLKSKYSYRKNYLSQYTIKCLKNLKNFKIALGLSVEEDDYIFTRWDSNVVLSPISFSDEYTDFRSKYGFEDFPLHNIRHTISNLLQEQGYSPKDVARYLGNTPRTLLENYTEISDKTEFDISTTMSDLTRNNKRKYFDVKVISAILNNDLSILEDKEDAYNLVDFINNEIVSFDDMDLAISNAKDQILSQYPSFKTFISQTPEELITKVETYKTFNNQTIEIMQPSGYVKTTIGI